MKRVPEVWVMTVKMIYSELLFTYIKRIKFLEKEEMSRQVLGEAKLIKSH